MALRASKNKIDWSNTNRIVTIKISNYEIIIFILASLHLEIKLFN